MNTAPSADTDGVVLKGQVLAFTDDPFAAGIEAATSFEPDGAVWIADGKVWAIGPAAAVIQAAPGAPVVDYDDALITAGFVDCHAHYPQLPIIASYGEQLLTWLETYTFPTEARYGDKAVARAAADFFLDQSLANGVTTTAAYATVHPTSVDAYFEAAQARGVRAACGKMLMDRHAPATLCDTPARAYDESKTLIERWHGKDRNTYIITPRFAPTSTPEQLDAAGTLWREHPDALMQTHLSENTDEINWVADLFPKAPDYLGVYEMFGLTGPGAIFGHAVHLTARERAALAEGGSAIAHCPTSNLFIGSGLFDLQGIRDAENPVTVGLASDVAGGTSLSPFATMRAAYEIAQLRGYSLHPAKAWYLATVGAAATMQLDGHVGNLAVGMDADIAVIDLGSTPLIRNRTAAADDIWDVLFAQIILADERAVRATWSGGKRVYQGAT